MPLRLRPSIPSSLSPTLFRLQARSQTRTRFRAHRRCLTSFSTLHTEAGFGSATGTEDARAGTEEKGKGKEKGKVWPKVVFSGIQPTGIPHLGNYLGAIQNWISLQNTHYPPNPHPSPSSSTSQISSSPSPPSSLQNEDKDKDKDKYKPATILYSIVGLHAITLPQDPKRLRRERRECLACLMACGLGSGGRSSVGGRGKGKGEGEGPILFFQEDVPEHAELAWYLNTLVGVGRLQRMTTWKSKLSIAKRDGDGTPGSEGEMEDHLGLGLLAYPVLQAADVMLYKSTEIPVGEDQQQHIELARDIAQSFNSRFGNVFPLPRHIIPPTKRILSLTDPSEKMSKSAPNPASRILITDTPEAINKKIRGAVTDSERSLSWDPEGRRGVGNLLGILGACRESSVARGLEEGGGTNLSYDEEMSILSQRLSSEGISSHSQLKALVADAVISKLSGIREEYERLRGDEGYLAEVAREGRERARGIARRTMGEVRRRVGLDAI